MSEEKKDTAIAVVDSGEFATLMDSGRFAQAWRVAKLFSETALVPKQFQARPADCFVAVQMALRMEIDPMALMQAMYVVHGKPGLESKMVIALVNTRGPFRGPIQWRESGAIGQPGYECTAFAVHDKTGEECAATVTAAMVKAEQWDKNTKWKTMPQLMYRYRSAAHLARLFCPEVIMGMVTAEELKDGAEVPEPIKVTLEKATPVVDAAKEILKSKVQVEVQPEPEKPHDCGSRMGIMPEKPKVEITDNTSKTGALTLEEIEQEATDAFIPPIRFDAMKDEAGVKNKGTAKQLDKLLMIVRAFVDGQ